MPYEFSQTNRENTASKRMQGRLKGGRHHVSVSQKQSGLSRKQTIAEIYAANIVSDSQSSFIDFLFWSMSDMFYDRYSWPKNYIEHQNQSF